MKNNSTITLTFLFSFLFITNIVMSQCPHPNATICDDFDAYNLDLISAQSMDWSPWSGTNGATDDAVVSDAQATSGTQSLLISEANGDDMLLLLGDKTSGNFKLSWDMYVPSGNSGYFNIQKIENDPGGEYGLQAFFNTDGTATIDAGAESVVTYNWTADTWMKIVLHVDLDNDWIVYTINGEEIYSFPASYGSFSTTGIAQLGSVNLYGWVGTVQYIDNVTFYELSSCSADAVFCDGYEMYLSGSTTGGQAPWWDTWSGNWGTAEDGIVTNEQAASGENSMLIQEGSAQDVVLLLGDRSFGQFTLSWELYIPANKVAYYNVQNEETPGVQWNLNMHFGNDAAGDTDVFGQGIIAETGAHFTYPEDTWFEVTHFFDLDNDTMTTFIDGFLIESGAPYTGDLGSIDFFSINDDNKYYVDDILFEDLTVYSCDNFSVGTASAAGETVVCFGDEITFEVAGASVPEDAVNGFNWIVTSVDISGSTDPYNEAPIDAQTGLSLEVTDVDFVNDGGVLSAGTYYFTAVSFGAAVDTDGTLGGLDFTNGCVETSNSVEVVLLPEYSDLTVDGNVVDEVTPPGNNGEIAVVVGGGSGSFSYDWSNGGDSDTLTGLAPGDYTVTITDDSGCLEDVVETYTVGTMTGTQDPALKEAIQLYPNPAKQFTNLTFDFAEAKDLKVNLFNNLGQLVLSEQLDNVRTGSKQITLQDFAPGIYFLNISDGENSIIEKLFVE